MTPVKQKRVVVYVPEHDYAKLRSVLILMGENVSSWIRKIILDFLNKKDF